MDDENYTKIKDGALIPTAPLPWFDYNCKRKVFKKRNSKKEMPDSTLLYQ
jgi:hypothetical protein